MSIKQLITALLLVSMGCQGAHEPGPTPQGPTRQPALHFLVLHDVSASIEGRVPRLDPPALNPVLDYAEEHGGTVAVVSFGVQSRPSVRAVFDPPVAAEQDIRGNVFLRQPKPDAQALARAAEDYRAYCTAERERFLAAVADLLEESADATNLVAGLARAEAFFSEAGDDAARILLVVSDFEDTTGAASFDLTLAPGVRVLAVSKDIRDFGILQAHASAFETFESIPAAIRAAVPGR